MPARIVVVHDEPGFVGELVSALRHAGHQVAIFADPLAAWDALAAAQKTEVLITRVRFPPGRSNGLALARMVRSRRRDIRVVFAASPRYASECEGEGTFLAMPVPVPHVVKTVELLLPRSANAPAETNVGLSSPGEDHEKFPVEPAFR